ncbi:MAG: adenosylcobalamin-dependent ribonucleoside-diphosphate reductase [Candidatus Shapirobacteria bacterium]|nr:adenosylcobalamin-dependent ribonucleoside-diphosphate reductase [Candidatus Shapirobacteria bacterium]
MTDIDVRQNINNQELMEPQLSENAKYIAETRYSRKNEDGKAYEKVKDIFWRVASNVAKGDVVFGKTEAESNIVAKEFYEVMAEQKFLPNTPCLINAGKPTQQLSACFVLPIDDSMDSILETMSNMAKIHKSGGGTGFSFSRLRPSGDYIKTSGGTTVGPVSFMQAYNDVTAQIKQGGVRRGANMGMLSIDHPDVLRFAVVKLDEWSLTNFNISLAVTDAFMAKLESDRKFLADNSIPEDVVEEIKTAEANRDVDARLREVEAGIKKLYDWAKATNEGEGYELINPRTNQVAMKLNAAKVFNLVTRLAWQYGDPGLVFIDRMNAPSSNPIPSVGRIEATNPCGEQPLLPYDACNLGSINLAKLVDQEKKDVNWEELKRIIFTGVHFLDNVVEVNEFPVQKIREMVSNTRRIGLGIMGFADALFKLGVKYDSEEGIAWAKKMMKFVTEASREATVELAKVRGTFPLWNVSVFANTDYKPRNMALTTIAPTGTISILADASSGIEPVFSLGYQKNTVEGKTLYNVNQVLVDELKKRGIYSEELIEKIVKNGGVLKDVEEVPEDLKNVFITALEIDPEWHIRIQAAFQEYTDNAVSKTINLPETATVDDVRKAYELSYSLGTKGITIYRTGSRSFEPLQKVKSTTAEAGAGEGKVVMLPPKKKPTPIIANGIRIKKKCDVGSVYSSIFYEEGDGPVEVFVTLGKSGGYLSAAAEVTGRLASLALKYGATLDEISEQLVGISCGQKVGMGNNAVLSMFDAVGKSLLEISRGEQLSIFGEHDEATHVDVVKSSEEMTQAESKFGACPDCGSPLRAEEGCFKCTNVFCGYSKCS